VRSSLTCFWRERAFWLLVNACLGEMRSGLSPERHVRQDGDGECSLSTPKDRVDLPLDAVSTFIQTARLVMGRGGGETRSG
jgi:hypothetical protein